MNKENMNKMSISDSNWVRLSAAYKKIIAKVYWRFIFDLLCLVENSTLWKHARTLPNQPLYGNFSMSPLSVPTCTSCVPFVKFTADFRTGSSC